MDRKAAAEEFLVRYRHHVANVSRTLFARRNLELYERLMGKAQSFRASLRDISTMAAIRRVRRPFTESDGTLEPVNESLREDAPEPMENATLFPDELSLLLKVSEIYLIPEHREMKKLSQRVRAANAHLIAIPAALAAMEAGVRLDKSFFHGIYHQYKRFDPDLAHEVYKAIIELRPRPEDVYRALNRVDPARVHYRRFLEELIKHMTTGRA